MAVAQPNWVFWGPPSGTVRLSINYVEPRIWGTISSVYAVLLQNQDLKCEHLEGGLMQIQQRKFFRALGGLAALSAALSMAGAKQAAFGSSGPANVETSPPNRGEAGCGERNKWDSVDNPTARHYLSQRL